MITFLPYQDFEKSAECLDWEYGHNRLDNQVNEGFVICKTLLSHYGEKRKTYKHPIVKMWYHYEMALLEYTGICLVTWMKRRGYTDDPRSEIGRQLVLEVANNCPWSYQPKSLKTNYPYWLGDEELHSNHRAILLGKLFSWYSRFGWTETPAVWTKENGWGYYWIR